MPYYITPNGRIRFGTMTCKGVLNAANVYNTHEDAQAVLDEAARKEFYEKLSAGNNLCKRALTHIHHLNTELVAMRIERDRLRRHLAKEQDNAGEN